MTKILESFQATTAGSDDNDRNMMIIVNKSCGIGFSITKTDNESLPSLALAYDLSYS